MQINTESFELLSSTKISSADAKNIFLPNEKEAEISGEVALWRAVITQALMDAGSNSNKSEARSARAHAISWLGGDSDDFNEVCELANLTPEYVRKKAKEAISRGCKWRQSNVIKFPRKNELGGRLRDKSIVKSSNAILFTKS
jgi:hypothetical protein